MDRRAFEDDSNGGLCYLRLDNKIDIPRYESPISQLLSEQLPVSDALPYTLLSSLISAVVVKGA